MGDMKVCCVFDDIFLLHLAEGAVGDMDIAYRLVASPFDINGISAALAFHMIDIDAIQRGRKTAISVLASPVEHIDPDHGFPYPPYLDPPEIKMLQYTAPASVGFDTDRTIQVFAIHAAILNKYVFYSAGSLTSNDHATMPVLHFAVFYNDVPGRDVNPPAILIAAAFDGDAIIPVSKGTVPDQYPVA